MFCFFNGPLAGWKRSDAVPEGRQAKLGQKNTTRPSPKLLTRIGTQARFEKGGSLLVQEGMRDAASPVPCISPQVLNFCTHLVSDLAMHEVSLHLEGFEGCLLHLTLKDGD